MLIKTQFLDFTGSPSPSVRKPLLNKSLRKYSRPIIFKDAACEESIFKNLAASFKLRPSLKISHIKTQGNKAIKACSVSLGNTEIPKKSQETHIIHPHSVPRSNTPNKYRLSKRKEFKPMFKRYICDNEIVVEGRQYIKNQLNSLISTTPEIGRPTTQDAGFYVDIKRTNL